MMLLLACFSAHLLKSKKGDHCVKVTRELELEGRWLFWLAFAQSLVFLSILFCKRRIQVADNDVFAYRAHIIRQEKLLADGKGQKGGFKKIPKQPSHQNHYLASTKKPPKLLKNQNKQASGHKRADTLQQQSYDRIMKGISVSVDSPTSAEAESNSTSLIKSEIESFSEEESDECSAFLEHSKRLRERQDTLKQKVQTHNNAVKRGVVGKTQFMLDQNNAKNDLRQTGKSSKDQKQSSKASL